MATTTRTPVRRTEEETERVGIDHLTVVPTNFDPDEEETEE